MRSSRRAIPIALALGVAVAVAVVLFVMSLDEAADDHADVGRSSSTSSAAFGLRSDRGRDSKDDSKGTTASGGGTSVVEERVDLRSPRPEQGSVVFEGKWGSGPGEFGHAPANESNPEGPMAIVGGRDGELWVVDQRNSRIQVMRDGRVVQEIDINDTAQDAALTSDGRPVVLDRLVDRSVKFYGPDGKLANEIPLEGKGIAEPGLVTGVIADDEGIWAELEHGTTVRVAKSDGSSDENRPELPGRPTRDGRFVASVLIADRARGELSVTVFDRATLEHRWSNLLELRAPILYVAALDSDARGRLYVAAAIGHERAEPPYDIHDEALVIVCLALESGVSLGQLETAALDGSHEMLRPVAADAAGNVYVMSPGTSGLGVRKYSFP